MSNLFTILNGLQLLFWSVLVFFLINIFQIGYLRINQPLPIENDHFWKIVTIFRRTVKHYRNIWLITKKAVILCQDDCYQNDRYLKCTPKWPLFNASLNYRSFCLARIPKWPSDYQNDRCSKWPFSKMTVNLAPNDRYTKITVILY